MALCFLLTSLTCQLSPSSLYLHLCCLMEFINPLKLFVFLLLVIFFLLSQSIFFSLLILQPTYKDLWLPTGVPEFQAAVFWSWTDPLGLVASFGFGEGNSEAEMMMKLISTSRPSPQGRCGPCLVTALCEIGGGRWWEGRHVWYHLGRFAEGQLSSAACQWTWEHLPCLYYRSEPILEIKRKKILGPINTLTQL